MADRDPPERQWLDPPLQLEPDEKRLTKTRRTAWSMSLQQAPPSHLATRGIRLPTVVM